MARQPLQEQRLAPDLRPGRIAASNRHGQQPGATGIAGRRIDEVMDRFAILEMPASTGDRRRADRATRRWQGPPAAGRQVPGPRWRSTSATGRGAIRARRCPRPPRAGSRSTRRGAPATRSAAQRRARPLPMPPRSWGRSRATDRRRGSRRRRLPCPLVARGPDPARSAGGWSSRSPRFGAVIAEPLEVGQDPGVEASSGRPSRSVGRGDGCVEAPAERSEDRRGRRWRLRAVSSLSSRCRERARSTAANSSPISIQARSAAAGATAMDLQAQRRAQGSALEPDDHRRHRRRRGRCPAVDAAAPPGRAPHAERLRTRRSWRGWPAPHARRHARRAGAERCAAGPPPTR